MKDLTEQIYDELNAQVIRMLEHARKQAERIAELERENSSLAYELNVALSGGSVSIPSADTDKLRDTLDKMHNDIMNLPCKPYPKYSDVELKAYKYGHKDARHSAAELVGSTALQAPVREVPGWISVDVRYPELTIRDENKVVIENRSIPSMTSSEKVIVCLDDGNRRIDRAVRLDGSEYTFFQSYGARVKYWQPLPAAPVQQEPKP